MSKTVFIGSLGSESWLYTTDGSIESTIALKKVSDYNSYTSPSIMAIGAGKAVFQAISSTDRTGTSSSRNDKYDIWFTDGTSEGTYDFSKIFPSLNVKFESLLSLGNGKFVFGNNDGVHGYEPWVTDGTISGTHLIKDLNPGAGNGYSDIPNFMAYLEKGKAIIGGQVTDGTQQGTFSLGIPGGTYSDLGNVRSLSEGKVFFTTNNYGLFNTTLWTTNGTKEGTHEYMTLPNGEMTALYYAVRVADGEIEFDTTGGGVRKTYLTDGTVAGTHVIQSGPSNSSAPYGQGANLGDGRVIFAQSDSEHGNELWIANHDMSSPKLLVDLQSGQYGSDPTNFTAMGDGRVMFSSRGGGTGAEPWVTDGTPEGTYVLDIVKGFSGVSPLGFANVGAMPENLSYVASITGNPSISEGASGLSPISFTVSLDKAVPAGSEPISIILIPNPASYDSVSTASLENTQYGTDWIADPSQSDAGYSLTNDRSLIVTFNPGDNTSKIVNVYAIGDNQIESDEKFSLGIALPSATNGSRLSINANAQVAFGTILNDDQIKHPVIVNTSADASLGISSNSDLFKYISDDIVAAANRISAALPGGLSSPITISVEGQHLGSTLGYGLIAAAGPTLINTTSDGGFAGSLSVPKYLYKYTFGDDPDKSKPDVHITVNLDFLQKFYNGKIDATLISDVTSVGVGGGSYDITTLLTHELLHGLGFGISMPVTATPWSIWQSASTDGSGFYYFNGPRSGSVLLTKGGEGSLDSHIAGLTPLSPELMTPSYMGPNINISQTDINILQDMGYTKNQTGLDLKFARVTTTIEAGTLNEGGTISPGAGQTQTFSGVSSGSITLNGLGTFVLTGTNTYLGPTTLNAGTMLIDGSVVSTVTVQSGATLGGHGSTGTVIVSPGGTLSPGNSPGVLTTRDLTLAAGATLKDEIGGTGQGQFDQTKVIGTVTLNGATLNLASYGSFVSTRGDKFVFIDNDEADAVQGTFAGLSEGASLTLGSHSYQISYYGGDGNDIVLTDVTAMPITVTPPSNPQSPSEMVKSLSVTSDNVVNDVEAKAASVLVSGTLSAALAAGEKVVVTIAGKYYVATADGTIFSVQVTQPATAGMATAHVVSADGIANADVNQAFIIDTVTPKAVLTGVSGQANHEIGHALSGDLGATDAGLTVTVRDGSTVLGTTIADSAGHFNFAVTDIKDGPSHSYNLTASATDAAGNVGTSDSFVFAFDYSANRDLFGTVAHDTASHLGQVYALYEGLLSRTPDQGGAQGWIDALDHGATLKDITQAFLTSAEGQSHLNATGNADYVEQLYGNVLDRASDASGKQAWVTALDHGVSRADVADSFVFSGEHLGQLKGAFDAGVYLADPTDAAVARLYHGLLDRAPDAAGLTAWEAVAHTGSALPSIAQSFLTSAEYVTGHSSQTDTQFVDSLYATGLGRPADAGGEKGWLSQLSQGATRADVAVGILQSQEAHAHFNGQIEQGWHLA
ncbi:DUF4214 domain-containing protein [Methylobacterium sp. WL103]|uniref:DUF4214 domain-containing protein n=1 Tax=Methylobacterium sp. WL103 TaxID=2603891 RepID=UPI00164F7D60|nr:DUF4214 domain-containing protein [Methylobacterium sp. WL103]